MEEVTKVVLVAGSEDQEAAERCRAIIGSSARILIQDDLGDWSDVGLPQQSDEVLWCGLDLARGPDMSGESILRDFRIRIPKSSELMTVPKRTHPSTAGELRRAERRRRR